MCTLASMKSLKEGAKAPSFALTDKSGKKISLKDIETPYTVVYFYPKDDTPGCTIEAKEFSEALPKFKKAGASIIGISGGTDKTKDKFCTKHNLKVTLLTDPDFTVSKAYKSYGKKKFMGREYMGIYRKTFLLDNAKKIVKIFDEVSPEGHADEVLELISKKPAKKPLNASRSQSRRK